MNKLAISIVLFLHMVHPFGIPSASTGWHNLGHEHAIAFPDAEGSDIGKPSLLVDKPFEAIGYPSAEPASS